MSRLSYSKASLGKHATQLKRYQQFLPSLDLKRQQLTAERSRARLLLQQTEQDLQQKQDAIGRLIPMLAEENIALEGLVSIENWEINDENVVGVHLPVLENINFSYQPYSFLSKPHWVDHLIAVFADILTLQMQSRVQQKRVALLDQAVKKITQRVNLFDKVLIPQTRENIRKIRIYLSDAEKAGVVNAKLTKKKRLLQE